MWEKFKEHLWNVLGLCAVGWVLAHLILIYIHGTVMITEAWRWVLIAEIVLLIAVGALGIERLIKDRRK